MSDISAEPQGWELDARKVELDKIVNAVYGRSLSARMMGVRFVHKPVVTRNVGVKFKPFGAQ